jgi:hypothetical protein
MTKQAMTDFDKAVLAAIHDAPYIEPEKQSAEVQAAIDRLRVARYLQPASLKRGAIESSETGARFLGYA